MNCRSAKNEIKAYIDGELGPIKRFLIARHIARCEDCRKEMDQMSDLTTQVKNTNGIPAPEGLRSAVLGRIDLKPQGQPKSTWWPYKTSPAAPVLVLITVGVMAAILMPTFQSAKESTSRTRMLQAQKNEEMLGSPVKSSAPGAAGGAPMAAPAWRMSRPGSKVATAPGASDSYHIEYADEASAGLPREHVPAPNLLVIKTADIKLQVKNFQSAYDSAVSMARGAGGYVTNSSAETSGEAPTSGRLTMRVPVDSFDRVMARLGGLGKVLSKNISGEDVTGEATDLESRIRNKRAEERQYLELMNRTKRIADIMAVSNELYRVRGEIEEAVGRLKYLKSSAAMSTINLEISEKEKTKPAVSGLHRTWNSAIGSLVATGKGLAALLIWLAVYSPFWALPIAAWIILKRRQAQAQA